MSSLIICKDGKSRCNWCNATDDYLNYHDTEWGFPVKDDKRLFEKLCLESFQCGLSWRTILEKRENFRAAFCHFDFNRVADFTQNDIERLLKDKGIVRHRGKIEAVINNAKQALELVAQYGSLAAFFWQYEADIEQLTTPQSISSSALSVALSKELKKRGWKFIGPTTAYAFMQAMGLINDHLEGCIIRSEVDNARRHFIRP
ncbi:MAG: DNA-3-methyladenine glycosylase I [Gammaproteobacteria bacterium]|nr:DNA-3-methyladenine glycosylase I [Gammaproteobacteria bacterium]